MSVKTYQTKTDAINSIVDLAGPDFDHAKAEKLFDLIHEEICVPDYDAPYAIDIDLITDKDFFDAAAEAME